jgi:hypothetical protein
MKLGVMIGIFMLPEKKRLYHLLSYLTHKTNLTAKPNAPTTAPAPTPPRRPSAAPAVLVDDVTDAGVTLAALPVIDVVVAFLVLEVNPDVVEDRAEPLERLVDVPDLVGVAVAPTRSVVTVPSGAVYSPVL